jgi:hypothetical protein
VILLRRDGQRQRLATLVAQRRAAPGRVPPSLRIAGLTLTAAAATLLAAGCGSAAGSTASGPASPGSGMSAYFSCLSQHGVKAPATRPSPGAGGYGGGAGFGGTAPGGSTFQKASQACASLRPSRGSGGYGGGGYGGFGGGFGSSLSSFRTCMSSHGEPIPSTRPAAPPAAGSPRIDRILNGLDPSNSKVAAALKACESKLPSFLQGGGQGSTGGTGGGAAAT